MNTTLGTEVLQVQYLQHSPSPFSCINIQQVSGVGRWKFRAWYFSFHWMTYTWKYDLGMLIYKSVKYFSEFSHFWFEVDKICPTVFFFFNWTTDVLEWPLAEKYTLNPSSHDKFSVPHLFLYVAVLERHRTCALCSQTVPWSITACYWISISMSLKPNWRWKTWEVLLAVFTLTSTNKHAKKTYSPGFFLHLETRKKTGFPNLHFLS